MGCILLVEDNADDAALTARKLAELHNQNPVVVADSYAEAVACLNTTRPALVILDLKLQPGEPGGLDVLRYIRADSELKDLPAIVLTVSQSEADRVNSYRLGINAYLRKPIEPMALFDAIVYLKIRWTLGAS